MAEEPKEIVKDKEIARNQSIEMILVQMGLLAEDGLEMAAAEKRKHPEKKLEDILLEEEIVSEFSWIRALGVKYNIPLVNLAAQKISSKVLRYVTEKEAREYHIIPVHETDYVLHIASNDPMNYSVFDKVSQACGKQVMVLLATQADIEESITQSYILQNVNAVMQQIANEFGKGDEGEEEEEKETILDLTQGDGKSNAIVQAVKLIMEQAYQRGASDIHLEPMETDVIIRIRVDGELVETMSFAKPAFTHISSRLKVLGGLDIAEKRVPQDGRMSVLIQGKKINMRISTLPTLYGEKIVIRILGSSDSQEMLQLEDLQMEDYNYRLLTEALKKPN
ncbi:MAG: ATPase, T2SS/T4P/T4SS family, partial [Lachnospiraceae bacterium]